MSTSANPYEQIVNDLKARRAQLDTDIALAEQLRDRWGGGAIAAAQNGSSQPQSGQPVTTIPSNAFFKMSIADATIKLLEMRQRRLTTNEIILGLEAGGLPRSTYNTVYSILSRRQSEEQDVEKIGKQWGLTEWSGKRKRKGGVIPLVPVEDQVPDDIPPDPDDEPK